MKSQEEESQFWKGNMDFVFDMFVGGNEFPG